MTFHSLSANHGGFTYVDGLCGLSKRVASIIRKLRFNIFYFIIRSHVRVR